VSDGFRPGRSHGWCILLSSAALSSRAKRGICFPVHPRKPDLSRRLMLALASVLRDCGGANESRSLVRRGGLGMTTLVRNGRHQLRNRSRLHLANAPGTTRAAQCRQPSLRVEIRQKRLLRGAAHTPQARAFCGICLEEPSEEELFDRSSRLFVVLRLPLCGCCASVSC
jgi:hypothetical protein